MTSRNATGTGTGTRRVWRSTVAAMLATAVLASPAAAYSHGIWRGAAQSAPYPYPEGLRPFSARYVGSLVPVTDLAARVAGHTLVLTQPWAGLERYQLRSTPVYLRADGFADSGHWIDVPWQAAGNRLCLNPGRTSLCYEAFSDATGQAFLLHRGTNLLARVTGTPVGDRYRVRDEFRRHQARAAAGAAVQLLMFGLLAEALISAARQPGGGGGGQTEYHYYRQPASPGPSHGSAPAPAISPFYAETPGHGK